MRLILLCLTSLALVQLSFQVQLLSYEKFTRQSTTVAGGVSSRAVDGNTNRNWNGGSCTHTAQSSNPYWQVHLAGLAQITKLRIYNRQDCCGTRLGGFRVYVSENIYGPFSICAFGPAATVNGQIINLNCNQQGRIVRIQIPGANKILTLCEVNIYGEQIEDVHLLSLEKSTSQSSVAWNGLASRAVDGNTNQIYGGQSCTHTASNHNAWWQVNLGVASYVKSLVIFNRADCCGNRLGGFKVLVSDNVNGPFVECGAGPGSTSNGQIISVDCNSYGKVVRIKLPGLNRILTLCEVKVYGEPADKNRLLSQGLPTRQSSITFNGVSSRAVDGNTNQNYNGGSCTHTAQQTNPWWEVLLQGLFRVSSLKIYNRLDCCGNRLSGLRIMISQEGFGLYTRCGFGSGPTSNGQILHLNCNAYARIVRIQLLGANRILTLCEVQVFGEPIDKVQLLSQGKHTVQSSVALGGVPSRAVDGNTNQNYNGGSCTHTTQSNHPFWEVHLPGLARITSVTVYNRGDCCGNRLSHFRVYIRQDVFSAFQFCAIGPAVTVNGQVIRRNCNGYARIIRIQLIGANKVLTLCEVNVYGEPL